MFKLATPDQAKQLDELHAAGELEASACSDHQDEYAAAVLFTGTPSEDMALVMLADGSEQWWLEVEDSTDWCLDLRNSIRVA
jgi:hypothetical protein